MCKSALGLARQSYLMCVIFVPERRQPLREPGWPAIRQAHIPAATAKKSTYSYIRRALSGTHDVVLNLYETTECTYSSDKCER